MNIIGNVIKQAIELRNQFTGDIKDVKNVQERQLVRLLEKAENTAFGKYYGFTQILNAEDPVAEFNNRVPIFDYDKIYQNWWKQSFDIPDITWPGKPEYFARSSGTTGSEPKRIPVSTDMIASIRQVGVSQLTSIANFDLPPGFFEKQILMLGSSTNLMKVGDHEEGEISGISASNIPGWFETVYKPGPEIAGIPDWDARVERIAREAPNWDIGAISGIPSWILLMLKEIIRFNNVKSIHDIWPGLKVYTPGGVAFEPFKPSFEDLFSKEVIYMDTYLASEGFFAYNARPGTNAMKLAIEHGIYFEFIPFDERGFDENGNLLENPLVVPLTEVDDKTNYALIVSTCAGTWRYMIGDTVRFTNIEEYEISITGRTKYFLNVVGSQLSEDKMNAAIKNVEETFHLPVEEYTLAAVKDKNDNYYHEWILGVEDIDVDGQKIAENIDALLKTINKNYGVARRKALNGVKVFMVSTQRFHDWHERTRRKGGQVKTKKLMKEEDFLEFKEFVLDKLSFEKV